MKWHWGFVKPGRRKVLPAQVTLWVSLKLLDACTKVSLLWSKALFVQSAAKSYVGTAELQMTSWALINFVFALLNSLRSISYSSFSTSMLQLLEWKVKLEAFTSQLWAALCPHAVPPCHPRRWTLHCILGHEQDLAREISHGESTNSAVTFLQHVQWGLQLRRDIFSLEVLGQLARGCPWCLRI